MSKNSNPYVTIVAESVRPSSTSGLHGTVHIRPALRQQFGQDIAIECSKPLTSAHPVGTKFRMRVKRTDREGGGQSPCSYHGWKVDVLASKL